MNGGMFFDGPPCHEIRLAKTSRRKGRPNCSFWQSIAEPRCNSEPLTFILKI